MSSIYRQNSHSSYVSSTTLPSPVMRRNSSGVPKKNTLLELSTQVISRTSTNNDGQSSIVFLDSVDGGDNNSNGGGVDGAGEEEEVVAEDENEVGIQDDAVPVNEGSTFRRYVDQHLLFRSSNNLDSIIFMIIIIKRNTEKIETNVEYNKNASKSESQKVRKYLPLVLK